MASRGEFAKSFGNHRKNGGTMTRREYGEWFRKQKGNQEVLPVVSTEEENTTTSDEVRE